MKETRDKRKVFHQLDESSQEQEAVAHTDLDRTQRFLEAAGALRERPPQTQKAILALLTGEASKDNLTEAQDEEFAQQQKRVRKLTGYLNKRKQQVEDLTAQHRELQRIEKAARKTIHEQLKELEAVRSSLQQKEEQADQLQARADNLVVYLNKRKQQVEDLSAQHRDFQRIEKAAGNAVRNAVVTLWGGYSEAGLENLQDLASCPFISNPVRATACYEIARFFADTGRVHSAARSMAEARRLSKKLMRSTRPRLLEYEMLLAMDDLETAKSRISEYIQLRPHDPNYRIGLANYFESKGDRAGQISAINELFANAGMEQIVPSDFSSPFLTLGPAEQPEPIEGGPKVTVMISCFNSAEFLELAVRSIQEQTWRNLEIIVTDDCSTDGSLGILKEMAARDSRLVILSNTETQGTYGNRNRMLAACSGDYVTVHDSDDWSHPRMIEHQVRQLEENEGIRLNTTLMCRVSLDLRFHLRPSRNSLEFCHMNYPGFLMRTEDVKALGGWDPIMANADAEFERRVKQVYGKDAFAIINPETVYSFFLVHENSLTQQKLMNLRSLTYGSRNEYHRQSEFWMDARRAEAAANGDGVAPFVVTDRTSRSHPFPSPNGLLVPRARREVLEYDVLIVSDLFLLGGTRSCNINYVKMMHSMGKKVALFNWPRGDLRLSNDIHPNYRQLAQDGLVEIITWEDRVKAKTVIVHHPPLAAMELDKYPTVETEKVTVLINQLPFQTQDRERFFYKPAEVTARLKRVFDCDMVEWVAISPLALEYISEYAGEIEISDQIFYPPIFTERELIGATVADRFTRMKDMGPKFARHSRDHWTKWPLSAERAAKMYMPDQAHRFSILGGGKTIGRTLPQEIPESWTVYDYDGISVPDLLNSSDIYLNFNNEIYIEEFGRNVMEGLYYGLPVITEPIFGKTFGDAVLIAGDDGPAPLVERLSTDRAFFEEQVARGTAFVEQHCSAESVMKKLEAYLG